MTRRGFSGDKQRAIGALRTVDGDHDPVTVLMEGGLRFWSVPLRVGRAGLSSLRLGVVFGGSGQAEGSAPHSVARTETERARQTGGM